MKVIEALKAMPVGEVVTNKRALLMFKKRGLICDYDPSFGYLESQWVYYKDGSDIDYMMAYSKRLIKEGEKGSSSNPFDSYMDAIEHGFDRDVEFEIDGMKFRPKYLSGCFSAYLYKAEDEAQTEEVNRSMCMWGAIV